MNLAYIVLDILYSSFGKVQGIPAVCKKEVSNYVEVTLNY